MADAGAATAPWVTGPLARVPVSRDDLYALGKSFSLVVVCARDHPR